MSPRFIIYVPCFKIYGPRFIIYVPAGSEWEILVNISSKTPQTDTNTLNTTRRRGWHCEVTVKVRKDARGSCLPKFDLHNILLEKRDKQCSKNYRRSPSRHRGWRRKQYFLFAHKPAFPDLACPNHFCDNTQTPHSIGVSNLRKHSPRPKWGIYW